jgi:membrane associated rhomboid family serine protease
MASPSTELLEMVLRECAAARPQPWYPSDYASQTGVPREALNSSLDHLRMGGLIRLTDWVQGKGQGYTLTPAGERVLGRPRLLGRLRDGEVPAVRAAEPAPWQENKPRGWERAKAVKAALLDSSRPVVTLGLLAANILVFLVGLQLASKKGLSGPYLAFDFKLDGRLESIWHDLGALKKSDVVMLGEWWRLLSCCFVHFGVIHLGMNMYALWILGPLLERMWGRWRFLLLYLVSGLGGSCAVMVLSQEAVFLAGASGALCGILASMATWVFLNRPYLPAGMASDWMRRIVINAILIACISAVPGVSAAGHFGGAVAGLVAAAPLTYSRFGEGTQRWLGLLGFLAVPAAALLWVQQSVPVRTEVDRARAVYGPVVQQAAHLALVTYNDDVVPASNKAMNEHAIAADAAQAALARVVEAQRELQKVSQQLAEAPEYDDARINQGLKLAKEYMDTWIEFFARFRRSLDSHGAWHPREGRALRQFFDEKVMPAEKQWKDSVLFSG